MAFMHHMPLSITKILYRCPHVIENIVYSFTYEIFNRLGQFIFGHFVCVWGVWIALLSRCNPFRCSSSPSDFFKKNLTKFHKYSNTGRGFKLVFSKVVTVTYKRTLCMCTKYRKYESTKEIKDKKIKKFNFSIS